MRILCLIVSLILLVTVYPQTTTIFNFGCKALSADGKTCTTCSSRFYKDQTGICQPVSTSCQTYNQSNGACKSCYSGFTLLQTICIVERASTLNPYCSKFNGTQCTLCSKGYYLNNNQCLLIDPLCKNFDASKIKCVQCYSGYELKNDGSCVIKPLIVETGGCAQFNNSICIKCSKGYYFDNNKICIAVDPLCKTFNYEKNVCSGCFVGFKLQSNQCVLQEDGQNCRQFDSEGNCINCSKGFYLDEGICIKIDVNCKKFDFKELRCQQCYGGYTLRSQVCINSNSIASQIAGFEYCAQWLEGVCVKCVERAFIDFQGNCQGVSSQCKTFDIFSGKCTSCFGGFTLSNKGQCTNDANSTQKNCANYDIVNKVCTKCYNGSFLNIKSQCQATDNNCQTFNYKTLVCDNCYRGYGINLKGICQQVVVLTTTIQNCIEIDANGMCLRCFNLYYKPLSENVCKEINPLCRTYNANNGRCTSCFNGFILNNQSGQCNYD